LTIKLVRKSRIDNKVIIYNDTEGLFSLVNDENVITESSDDITALTASASWRRPTRDEVSSYVYKNNRVLHAPSIDHSEEIQQLLQDSKTTTATLLAAIPDFKKLYDWGINIQNQTEQAEKSEPELNPLWSYYAVSDKENTPEVNNLYAADPDGDMFIWDGEAFTPIEDTVDTFEAPTVIDIDPDTAKRLQEWITTTPDDYLDISELDPEEKALFDAALREMDLYMLDNQAAILSSASKLWYDNHDKYLRQENQSRDWHGRYDGAQAPKERKLFFPKARSNGEVNLDIWKAVLEFVKQNSVEAAAAEEHTMYIAIVDPVDTSAVLDLIAIITNPNNSEPVSWVRRNGEWVQDNTYLDKIKSVTPPTTTILDDDSVSDVIKQIDASDAEKEDSTANVEEYICAALAHNCPEKINKEWVREPINPLYGKYGEVLTAGGVPGVADTPEDFAAVARLKKYWAFGKGTAKWRPGTDGDLTRLHNHLAKYVGPNRAWGLAQNIFKMHFGMTNNKYDKLSGD
jgi:hypothetical protein